MTPRTMENGICGILVADPAGLCIYTSPHWNGILGSDAVHCLGDGWLQFLNADDRAPSRAAWSDAVRERRESTFQFRVSRANHNGLLRLQVSPMPGHDGNVTGFIATLHDLTDHQRIEAERLQSQKMEAIGRLAGGLAHDFANLLTLISGYSEILLNRMSPSDPLRAELDEIRTAANRGSSLTTQLLAFTRSQSVEPQILDLNELVLNMERMLRRMIPENIELVTDLLPDLGRVKADAGQMEQVIMNLAVNARDALPGAGRITIRTSNVEVEADGRSGVIPGSYVTLQFADTGMGMDAETMSRVFEPFFTTKERGKGTGLGLTTVHGIVKQSNGYVSGQSEPGKGAIFTIYLPRVEEKAEALPPNGNGNGAESGTETILVVEDEPGVRRLLKHVLSKRGYTVLEACDGSDALEIHESCGRHIDLLLTDIVMPRMSGRELSEHMLALQPDLKVLCMSGYTDDVLVRTGALQPGACFLQKPLKPDVLVSKLRELLDSRPCRTAPAPARLA